MKILIVILLIFCACSQEEDETVGQVVGIEILGNGQCEYTLQGVVPYAPPPNKILAPCGSYQLNQIVRL